MEILPSENANSVLKLEIPHILILKSCNGALNRLARILHSENGNSVLRK